MGLLFKTRVPVQTSPSNPKEFKGISYNLKSYTKLVKLKVLRKLKRKILVTLNQRFRVLCGNECSFVDFNRFFFVH